VADSLVDAEVAHFVANVVQQRLDFFFVVEAGVIGCDGNFHFR
jgi:hypothetical protein